MTMTEPSKILVLHSMDGQAIEVDRAVAERSMLIKNLLSDIPDSDEPIPIPNVSSTCKHIWPCSNILSLWVSKTDMSLS
jgi:hypothetical protein